MKFSGRAALMVLILTLACSAGVFAGGGQEGGSAQAGKQVLRFGHTLTEQDAYNVYMRKWAEAVSTATNGDIVIEIYPSSQLGSEEDVLEQIRQGANIGWQTDFARLGSYVKGLSVVNAPFFVSDLDEALKLQQSAAIKSLNKELADKFGIAHISFDWIQGQRHVFTNKPAKSPEELKGLRIRTAPAPIWVESVNSLGCTAVSLSYGEIYTGIQTKVVDGCELPYNAANNLKIFEVAKYVIETGHIFQLNAMVVSHAWLQKLPQNYQSILISECDKAGLEASKALADQTAASKKNMTDKGITVIGRDQLDMQAFIRESAKAYAALGLTDVRAAVYRDIGKN
ncbi:MAG: C4-dicarboxylate TRAP transporter substrate-binding protein [Spirochaetales bacterium]|jgi:TRAP-type C4-dicarboxylate transport system substrate-binding protein|nr:C4-dicarboxylate TRAP transporter substrate-binding protein [Spirochaetales bacterium]